MPYTPYYRTSDGLEDYQFEFVEHQEGKWRAYIMEMPSYGFKDSRAEITHGYVMESVTIFAGHRLLIPMKI